MTGDKEGFMASQDRDLPPQAREPNPYLEAIREAWSEFRCGVEEEAYYLADDEHYWGHGMPPILAWICSPWKPLLYRFRPYNLERLFRPLKAERRQRLSDLREYVFWCGDSDWNEERWQEADALVAEFGGAFPPRGYEPMSVAELIGMNMGLSREEVAEIVSKVPA